jgi:GNAT superfamily N-acetyltransferase
MHRCPIRPATVDDAASVVVVLRDSIVGLCTDDHQNDPATLARWLRNKTTENFRQWLQDPERYFVVAETDSRICGVGMLRRNGALDLCYVLPGKERLGIGSALVRALEAQARHWRLNRLQLISTVNARTFYEHLGYECTGEASVPGYGVITDYYYAKSFTPEA